MNPQTIRTKDGTILYEGLSESRRSFVVELVGRGASLANADLHGINVSYVDVTDGDFRNADLSNAVMKGTSADRAVFDGAILDGVRAEGMVARNASFRETRIGRGKHSPASFAGAILTYSDFDDTDMDRVVFEGAGITGSSWRQARALRCRFTNSWFSNADHAGAEYVDCDMTGASMRADPVSTRIPLESMPDRTRGTIAIGNVYGNLEFDGSMAAFGRDRKAGRIEKGICWSVSTSAILAGTGILENLSSIDSLRDVVTGLAGTGLAFFAVSALGGFLGERLNDVVKDAIDRSVVEIQRFVRSCVADLAARGSRIRDIGIAVLAGPGMRTIADLMASEPNGMPSPVSRRRQRAFGNCTIVVASRSRIAECLQRISENARGKSGRNSDLLVLRTERVPSDAPSAVRYFGDGAMAAFWIRDGRIVGRTGHDGVGRPVACSGEAPRTASATEIRRSFERALLDAVGAPPDFTYPSATHEIVAGQDGSIVVVESGRSLPSNVGGGYVIVRRDGTAYTVESARKAARDGYASSDTMVLEEEAPTMVCMR